jgi:uncharacterized membrane protein YbhN (UPF0104 family)
MAFELIETLPATAVPPSVGAAGLTPPRPAFGGIRRLAVLPVVVVAGGAVYLAAHRDGARAILEQLGRLPAVVLAAALASVLAQMAFQSLRLWAAVPAGLGLTMGRVLRAWALGEWLNIFVPARGGDALKAVLMARGVEPAGAGLPSATGALLADKLVDLASLVLLCGVGGVLSLLWARAGTGAVSVAVGVAIALGLVLALRLGGVRLGPRQLAWTRDLARGFSALRSPGRTGACLSFSLAAWIAEGVALTLLCGALGARPAPSQILLVLVLLNIGTSLPIALANLGVYEAALAAGLTRIGFPLPAAVAVAVTHHALELLGMNAAAAAAWLFSPSRRAGGTGGIRAG